MGESRKGRTSAASSVQLDVLGRRVTGPKSGVYFVRAESGKLIAEGGTRKVVIAR
jgi:hypothetical protein